MKLFRILDPFTLTLITVVLLASFFPARGDFVPFFENLTTAAIAPGPGQHPHRAVA